jgi:hypothetical protein
MIKETDETEFVSCQWWGRMPNAACGVWNGNADVYALEENVPGWLFTLLRAGTSRGPGRGTIVHLAADRVRLPPNSTRQDVRDPGGRIVNPAITNYK